MNYYPRCLLLFTHILSAKMGIQSLLLLCFLFLSHALLASDEPTLDEDLLVDERIEFEFEHASSASHSWLDDTRTTFQQTYVQGRRIEIERSELRLEYEAAPWEGAYFRFDNKYSYYWSRDALANLENTSYGYNKLQQASLQLSRENCAVTVGRQRLFWGVVEGTFAVDVITPFDYTEQLLTDYASVRLSQDMLIADCFFEQTKIQLFYLPEALLDSVRHRNNEIFDALERQLSDEWGMNISKSWPGFDLSLMYARLYANTPVPLANPLVAGGIELGVPQHDFFGLSAAWALGRMMIELDLAYKPGQLEPFSRQQEKRLEGALGIEYTTTGNHYFNAGVWRFDGAANEADAKSEPTQAWTAGWSKRYINDDLTMSFLGSWVSESEQVFTTLFAQYQWDDYWMFSSALSYTDIDENTQNPLQTSSDLTATMMVKVQF